MKRRKIAILLGQAEESYQHEFIVGASREATSQGFDVYVFSMFIKYQNNKDREEGDSNIFNLINYEKFDAVIILSDTIQTPGVEKKIEDRIHERFPGPVVCIDTDSEYFYNFWTDGYSSVYSTVSHLIEKHGVKDIAYLTGRRNHVHSRRRIEAYWQAMLDHQIEVREDRIFYGDFWYTSGTGCAEALLRNRDNLPKAMVCANDCMAIGFADEMEKNGVRIPEDILLVGYGTTEEGQMSPKSLTSTYIPAGYYGKYAVQAVQHLLNNEEVPEPNLEASIYIGESCGCEADLHEVLNKKRSRWMSKNSEEGYYSIHNYLMEDLLLADSLEDLFRTAFEHIYFLREIKHLEICLNNQWLKEDCILENKFPAIGYSKQMINVLSYYEDDSSVSGVGIDRLFESSEMLPNGNDGEPRVYMFSPLFFEDKSYGYAVLGYDVEDEMFSEAERLWLTAIARALESFRRLSVVNILEKSINLQKRAKFPILPENSSMSKEYLVAEEDKENLAEVEKILNENLLKYHFQPIVNAVDGEIYSYEALMRSGSSNFIPPLEIIRLADALGRLSDVEKATFINVLNIVDEKSDIFADRKVFINSIPGSKLEYNDFVKIEKMLKSQSGRAVVELTEQAELTDNELEELKAQYRRIGIGLAVDDYGTGYSNVSNLLRYMPDIVKIDRSLLSEIQNSSQKQHFVREVIDFCHANNILALAEGVETTDELATVIRLGADLIQGYYVARPREEIVTSVDSNVKMEIARYHREKVDGYNEQIFIAGRNNRISINSLLKEGKNTIVIGNKESTFRDITIVGTPNTDTSIHIEVLEGFDGRVILENVCLSTKKMRPCIHMADNCNLTIVLEGDNVFKGGGIMVPESSSLNLEGDGNLKIILTGAENYGIGNAPDKGHGIIRFYQDGEIFIDSRGQTIIGIGSGLGGEIGINKGKYVLLMHGDEGVAIGSFKGNTPLVIHDCDLFIDSTFYKGVSIGNIENDADVDISRSLIKFRSGGKRICVIGSVDGEKAKVYLHDLNFQVDVSADYSTSMGSLAGESDIIFNTAALKYVGMGRKALVYGGYSEKTSIDIDNVAIDINIKSDDGKITYAPSDKFITKYVRSSVVVNDKIKNA